MVTKTTIRIPTAQYAYMEYEFVGTTEQAIKSHNKTLKAYLESQKAPQIELYEGFDKKDLMRVMDKYLTENAIELDDVEKMGTVKNLSQKDMFNIIRMSLARIKNKLNQ